MQFLGKLVKLTGRLPQLLRPASLLWEILDPLIRHCNDQDSNRLATLSLIVRILIFCPIR